LIEEATRLSKAGVNGQLHTRGNVALFKGGFRDVVEGINATLDAVVEPISQAATYVKRIGNGDIPAKITPTIRVTLMS
jgi:methyl-accepting chemotaxis protein